MTQLIKFDLRGISSTRDRSAGTPAYLLLCFCLLGILILPACGPKTQEIELSYLIKDNQIRYERIPGVTLVGKKPRLRAYVIVTNTSDYAGVFKLHATFTSQGNSIDLSDEEFLKPGESIELSDEVEINPYSFEANVEVPSWGIIAPRKTIQL